ncbi:hypothetical protein BH11MYX2_BH11MYX2_03310 [soil metagenome]
MKRLVLSLAVLAACGAVGQEKPLPQHRAAEANSDVATAALRASKFADAREAATAALGRDPRDARAAAVRAIANYQISSHNVFGELESIIRGADNFKFFDHAGGRAAWQRWLNMLEGAQNDLEITAADDSFSLELCLACWQVDWNRSGSLDERDGHFLEIEVDHAGKPLPDGDPRRRPTFHFDRGDAEWALAMLSFQRAFGEIVLAYKWSAIDQLETGDHEVLAIPVGDKARVTKARTLILDGLAHADKCRTQYLAETDDDREWVPNPRQKSYSVPLEMDASVYATWDAVIGDVRRMLESQEGVSLRDLAKLADAHDDELRMVPDAYIDIGRMLREPTEIRVEMKRLITNPDAATIQSVLRGVLGTGYRDAMKASPLPGRLRAMKTQMDRGEDTFDRKLRYLLWLN